MINISRARAWGLPLADAEEAVQDALLDFLAALDRFEVRSRLKTFHCQTLKLWLKGVPVFTHPRYREGSK